MATALRDVLFSGAWVAALSLPVEVVFAQVECPAQPDIEVHGACLTGMNSRIEVLVDERKERMRTEVIQTPGLHTFNGFRWNGCPLTIQYYVAELGLYVDAGNEIGFSLPLTYSDQRKYYPPGKVVLTGERDSDADGKSDLVDGINFPNNPSLNQGIYRQAPSETSGTSDRFVPIRLKMVLPPMPVVLSANWRLDYSDNDPNDTKELVAVYSAESSILPVSLVHKISRTGLGRLWLKDSGFTLGSPPRDPRPWGGFKHGSREGDGDFVPSDGLLRDFGESIRPNSSYGGGPILDRKFYYQAVRAGENQLSVGTYLTFRVPLGNPREEPCPAGQRCIGRIPPAPRKVMISCDDRTLLTGVDIAAYDAKDLGVRGFSKPNQDVLLYNPATPPTEESVFRQARVEGAVTDAASAVLIGVSPPEVIGDLQRQAGPNDFGPIDDVGRENPVAIELLGEVSEDGSTLPGNVRPLEVAEPKDLIRSIGVLMPIEVTTRPEGDLLPWSGPLVVLPRLPLSNPLEPGAFPYAPRANRFLPISATHIVPQLSLRAHRISGGVGAFPAEFGAMYVPPEVFVNRHVSSPSLSEGIPDELIPFGVRDSGRFVRRDEISRIRFGLTVGRGLNSRRLVAVAAPFMLRRPPVVVVHGINSNNQMWDSRIWNNGVTNRLRTRVYFADYRTTAHKGYIENLYAVTEAMKRIIADYRSGVMADYLSIVSPTESRDARARTVSVAATQPENGWGSGPRAWQPLVGVVKRNRLTSYRLQGDPLDPSRPHLDLPDGSAIPFARRGFANLRYAITRVDAVGHSLGGQLLRTWSSNIGGNGLAVDLPRSPAVGIVREVRANGAWVPKSEMTSPQPNGVPNFKIARKGGVVLAGTSNSLVEWRLFWDPTARDYVEIMDSDMISARIPHPAVLERDTEAVTDIGWRRGSSPPLYEWQTTPTDGRDGRYSAYSRPGNLFAGDFRRVVTIGSPFAGSPLADLLAPIADDLSRNPEAFVSSLTASSSLAEALRVAAGLAAVAVNVEGWYSSLFSDDGPNARAAALAGAMNIAEVGGGPRVDSRIRDLLVNLGLADFSTGAGSERVLVRTDPTCLYDLRTYSQATHLLSIDTNYDDSALQTWWVPIVTTGGQGVWAADVSSVRSGLLSLLSLAVGAERIQRVVGAEGLLDPRSSDMVVPVHSQRNTGPWLGRSGSPTLADFTESARLGVGGFLPRWARFHEGIRVLPAEQRVSFARCGALDNPLAYPGQQPAAVGDECRAPGLWFDSVVHSSLPVAATGVNAQGQSGLVFDAVVNSLSFPKSMERVDMGMNLPAQHLVVGSMGAYGR